jgi:hypothetical protein
MIFTLHAYTYIYISGIEVGPATGEGIWDPSSWGQYLGGTSGTTGTYIYIYIYIYVYMYIYIYICIS